MKNIKLYIVLSLTVILVIGCEDYSAKSTAVHGFELVSQAPGTGNTIDAGFTFDCTGDGLAVWWGDETSDYDKYYEYITNPRIDTIDTGNYPSGESFIDRSIWDNETITTHTYSSPGSYNVVVIASSSGNFGTELNQSIARKTITIGN